MTERDTQRARVYAADDVLEKHAKPLPKVEDMERYVKWVWSSKRLRASYPKAFRYLTPKVRDGRGHSRNATGDFHAIDMPRWSRKSNVVLHELAHVITIREFGSWTAGHGWQYCSVFLRMTLLFMGREAHDDLKASFKQHRVRFTAPRKRRPMDPERKAELVARLAAYREQQRAAA